MYGFVEQVLHYFNRPHTAPPTVPLAGAAAWTGRELAGSSEWRVELSDEQVADLERALEVALRSGKPTHELTVEEFPLPVLGVAVERWRCELAEGRGFLLVRGVPVERWSQEQAEHADERLYRTNKRIRFHCDAADVVGLLCLSTSSEGGASRLVSSVTAFNHLLATKPALARRLFEPVYLDARRPPSDPLQYTSVQPCAFDGRKLRTFMHVDYFRSVERHAGIDLDALAREVIDEWEAFAERPGIHLDMELRRGDLQLVSNHTVVHARTAYADDPASPRHLLRLWLSLV